MNDSATGARCR
ncbi:Protein of unknown function [Escherichia coli D6-113.11]|nr:Protein of unknown function [Escherichia coli D6-113.11]CDU35448.1 Protein of unknown function [Escherichia coli D6-113.11]